MRFPDVGLCNIVGSHKLNGLLENQTLIPNFALSKRYRDWRMSSVAKTAMKYRDFFLLTGRIQQKLYYT